jgi:RNA polymerase sigma factor (sigma-70 family)
VADYRWHQREDQWRAFPKIRKGEFVDPVATVTDTSRRADPERITTDHLVVTSLLRKLPERERVVVTHLYLLGASQQQVATYLGVSDAALRMIAMRARRHVRAFVVRMRGFPIT